MTPATSNKHLSLTYPTAWVRGRLITRLEERTLAWTVLDAATADEMGQEQVGWFVGNHQGFAKAAEQLGRLDANPEGGIWIVVPRSKDISAELWLRWPHPQHVPNMPTTVSPEWRSRQVWVAPPERLARILPSARNAPAGIAGVIVLDPQCTLHKQRGGTDRLGHTFHNDRPQHVVNFRAALEIDGWQPPFILLTRKPAKSVCVEQVARVFCLNVFRFIAAESFGCWDEAIQHEAVSKPESID